jgi:hypothetical protein
MKKRIIFILFIVILIYVLSVVKWSKLFSHGVLSDAHKALEESGECKACHTKGKKLDNDKCLLCHEKIKQKIDSKSGYHARVSYECADCHSEHHGKSYSLIHLDIKTFDHRETGWPLNGVHAKFRCEACHLKDTYLLDKVRCIDCHIDVHMGQLGMNCNECHNEESFKITNYQHKNRSNAPQGKHLAISCDQCHQKAYREYLSKKAESVQYAGIAMTCNKCHEDVHDGENGKNCEDCHTQLTFTTESR